jgi:hypothetical protein
MGGGGSVAVAVLADGQRLGPRGERPVGRKGRRGGRRRGRDGRGRGRVRRRRNPRRGFLPPDGLDDRIEAKATGRLANGFAQEAFDLAFGEGHHRGEALDGRGAEGADGGEKAFAVVVRSAPERRHDGNVRGPRRKNLSTQGKTVGPGTVRESAIRSPPGARCGSSGSSRRAGFPAAGDGAARGREPVRRFPRRARSEPADGFLRGSRPRKRLELVGGDPPPRAAERARFGAPSHPGPVEVQVHREVAVGVPHDADALESPEGKPGFLPHLATTRGRRSLSAPQLPAGKLPEAAQQSGRGTTKDEPSAVALDRGHGRDHVRLRRPRRADREDAGIRQFLARATVHGDRAGRTIRRALETDGLAQFHDGLIERPGARLRQPALETCLEPRANRRPAHVVSLQRPARDHPHAVGLERDDRLVEREAGDRRRDVGSYPGKPLEVPSPSRKVTVELPHDGPRGAVEMTGPGVVAGALPDLEHVVLARRGEFAHGRKSTHESVEVSRRVTDPGLLQEHFRNPDSIGVAVSPPRERTTSPVEPRQQISRERRR